MLCHYWCFSHGFKLQDSVSNRCHDLTMLCLNISGIDIITVQHCIIQNIIKSDEINLLKSAVLKNCGYVYKNICPSFQSIQDSFFTFFV